MTMPPGVDHDVTIAAIDVIGRMGAKDVEVGYLDEDAPTAAGARWWATAHWNGTKILAENHTGPDVALDALARQLLDGGHCTHCGQRIRLGAPPRRAAKIRGVCFWRRTGDRWIRSCRVPEGARRIPPPATWGDVPRFPQ